MNVQDRGFMKNKVRHPEQSKRALDRMTKAFKRDLVKKLNELSTEEVTEIICEDRREAGHAYSFIHDYAVESGKPVFVTVCNTNNETYACTLKVEV